MNPESIDRIEHSTYTPLEKKYLKVQFVKVALVYLGLMAVSLFLLCAEGFAYRYAATIIVECGLLVASVVNLLILPRHTTIKDSLFVSTIYLSLRDYLSFGYYRSFL